MGQAGLLRGEALVKIDQTPWVVMASDQDSLSLHRNILCPRELNGNPLPGNPWLLDSPRGASDLSAQPSGTSQ
jgi:hypothetical protein